MIKTNDLQSLQNSINSLRDHRRQRALDEKRTHILARVFRGEVTSESR